MNPLARDQVQKENELGRDDIPPTGLVPGTQVVTAISGRSAGDHLNPLANGLPYLF